MTKQKIFTSKTCGWFDLIGRRSRCSVTGTSRNDAKFFNETICGNGIKHSPIKSSLTMSWSQTLRRRTAPRSVKTFDGKRCLKTKTIMDWSFRENLNIDVRTNEKLHENRDLTFFSAPLFDFLFVVCDKTKREVILRWHRDRKNQ